MMRPANPVAHSGEARGSSNAWTLAGRKRWAAREPVGSHATIATRDSARTCRQPVGRGADVTTVIYWGRWCDDALPSSLDWPATFRLAEPVEDRHVGPVACVDHARAVAAPRPEAESDGAGRFGAARGDPHCRAVRSRSRQWRRSPRDGNGRHAGDGDGRADAGDVGVRPAGVRLAGRRVGARAYGSTSSTARATRCRDASSITSTWSTSRGASCCIPCRNG